MYYIVAYDDCSRAGGPVAMSAEAESEGRPAEGRVRLARAALPLGPLRRRGQRAQRGLRALPHGAAAGARASRDRQLPRRRGVRGEGRPRHRLVLGAAVRHGQPVPGPRGARSAAGAQPRLERAPAGLPAGVAVPELRARVLLVPGLRLAAAVHRGRRLDAASRAPRRVR